MSSSPLVEETKGPGTPGNTSAVASCYVDRLHNKAQQTEIKKRNYKEKHNKEICVNLFSSENSTQ